MTTLAVFDLDGTITKSDTYRRYMLGYLLHDPNKIINTLGLPFDVLRFLAGIVDNSWLKERFLRAILGGVDLEQLSDFTGEFVNKLLDSGLRKGALEAIKNHQSNGDRVILVTASFDFYVKRIGERLGIHEIICTKASITQEGKLAGFIDGQNCYGERKVELLRSLLGDDRSRYKIIVYTDHHSDVPLMEWGDEVVAVNPTEKLTKHADRRGYKIVAW